VDGISWDGIDEDFTLFFLIFFMVGSLLSFFISFHLIERAMDKCK
jgi:predicted cation transporter